MAETRPEEAAHLFDTTAAVAQFPGVASDVIELDSVVRFFQAGKDDFLEQRVPEFGPEDMDDILFGLFPAGQPDRKEVEQVGDRGRF